MKFVNPIIRGFYPDPSVCKADGRYYMVTSTFQYFPGVALFESSDMLNFKQIGSVLTRKSQLPLKNAGTSGGIYAPTIRYHEGRFYMVVTNVSHGGNFYVWTDDIHGEWSDPIYVDQGGIDPTIFWDDDGSVYFMSNEADTKSEAFEKRDPVRYPGGLPCISMCEIDIETGKKLSETRPLWYGNGGRHMEAPHLYKINGWYYMLDAEGGTEYGHMVCYARSRNLWGPWEAFPGNPALTMRDNPYSILQGSGHGDLIEDDHGNWWFVNLAFRTIPGCGQHHHLGRETCLNPVSFKDGWFYIGNGEVKTVYDLPELPGEQESRDFNYTFETLSKDRDFLFLHAFEKKSYRFKKDSLTLTGTSASPFIQSDDPVFAGIRQTEFQEDMAVTLESAAEEAGVTVYMDSEHHYDLYLENGTTAVLRMQIGCVTEIKKTASVSGKLRLSVHADDDCYTFRVTEILKDGGTREIPMGSGMAHYLSSETAGGFTGVLFGMYAIDTEGKKAVFTALEMKHEEEKA